MVLALTLAAPLPLPAQSASAALAKGRLHRAVAVADRPDHTYALYLPTAYDRRQPRPLLLAFCAGGDGAGAVARHQRAAEAHGWIVAGSNVSRNGPPEPSQDAARTLLADVRARFAVDEARLYACGLSGGACVANWLAQSAAVPFAGVFLHARGDITQVPGGPARTFHLLAPGAADFNFDESVRYLVAAEKVGATAVLDVQPGGHEWASAAACERFLRFAEIEHALAAAAVDERVARLLTAEFDDLVAQLDGALPWLAQRRLAALAARLPDKDKRCDRLRQRWAELSKQLTADAADERAAWDELATKCQFDAAIDGRYPSAASVRAVDQARRDLLARWTGTTAAELALLSRQNTPVSLARALGGDLPPEAKEAYVAVATQCADHGVPWLARARELIAANKLRRAIGALQHGVRAGAVQAQDLAAEPFAKLRNLPAFQALLAAARGR
jgi:hypothetical protein